MNINDNGLTGSSLESKIISTESEEIFDQPLVSKSKSEFNSKEEKQQRLVTLAEDTRRRLKRSAMDIYCIGLNLLEAQNIIEHGEFLPWLRKEFGMGKTSAYEFIHVAKAFESKLPVIGNLINNITPTALCKLAAPSTPEAARDEAIDIVKAGEVIDPDIARNLINKYKTSKAGEKQQQKTCSTSQKNDINQVATLVSLNNQDIEIEQKPNNDISLSADAQQDELQKLVVERDSYKAQLKTLQILNAQLELDNEKLRSELKLFQNVNNTE